MKKIVYLSFVVIGTLSACITDQSESKKKFNKLKNEHLNQSWFICHESGGDRYIYINDYSQYGPSSRTFDFNKALIEYIRSEEIDTSITGITFMCSVEGLRMLQNEIDYPLFKKESEVLTYTLKYEKESKSYHILYIEVSNKVDWPISFSCSKICL